MKIGLAVSGTGGHLYPAISLAEFAKKQGDEIVFFCPKNSTSLDILKSKKFDLIELNFCGWKGRKIISLLRAGFLFFGAFFSSILKISKNDLDVIIGFGGYLAFPVCIAGKILGKKIVIHEQNSYPGLSNLVLHKIADITALGFIEAGGYFKDKNKLYFTGNPVRKEFLEVSAKDDGKKQNILILGGSQGAVGLNKIVIESLKYLEDCKISFTHIAGKKDKKFVESAYQNSVLKNDYKVFDYYENIYELFGMSDLVVSRSGASTIAEILTVGIPAVFVPYPYATNDHQTKNAEIVKNKGIAEIFQENNIKIDEFVKILKNMLNDSDLKKTARKIGEEFKLNNFAQKFYDILKN